MAVDKDTGSPAQKYAEWYLYHKREAIRKMKEAREHLKKIGLDHAELVL